MPFPIPAEIAFRGIYMPPSLLVGALGLVAAWLVSRVMNFTRLARFFWNPPLAFLAMWVLCSAFFGMFFLAP